MSFGLFAKPANRWIVGTIVAATALTGAIATYTISQFGTSQSPPSVAQAAPTSRVTALARLEPETEVIQLSAPLSLDGDRVAQLLVKENDPVRRGQVIAILDSRDRLQDALVEAQERVKMAEAELAKVRAGAKAGEIQAQRATISRLQAELNGQIATQQETISRWESEVRIARAEYQRYQDLYREGAVTASNLDSKRLTLETTQAQLREAEANQNRTADSLREQLREATATLDRIAEVRPVDIQAAEADVSMAIAAVRRAETDLEKAYIRAPINGQVLKIHTRPGEKLSDDGIVELAQNSQMVAVAEVYQSDIGKVQVGQSAIVTGQAFNGEVQGVVSQIGLQVSRQNVFSNQPGENADRRVIEVKIRLTPEDSKKVAGLTNLQVQAAIQVDSRPEKQAANNL